MVSKDDASAALPAVTPADFTTVRIFVSSPGDVADERKSVDEVVAEFNRVQGEALRIRLQVSTYNDSVVPRIGPGPQQTIDAQLPPYDVYLGIMARRFGTPTQGYGSGTEKEFRDALATWQTTGRPWIIFYFKDRVTAGLEEAEQLAKVNAFRNELKTRGLISTYSNLEDIRKQLSRHLHMLLARKRQRPDRPPLVITSASPRRRALLEQTGLRENVDFILVPAAIPVHDVPRKMNILQAKKQVLTTARQKIYQVLQDPKLVARGLRGKDTIIVGVDTVVLCNGGLLDRPLLQALEFAGEEDLKKAARAATEMLMSEHNQKVDIITGLVLVPGEDPLNATNERSVCVVTEAWMKNFTEHDIDSYVLTKEPFDKAGAFGIQGQGVALFKEIRGNYTNVVGLPLPELWQLLQDPLFADRITLPGPSDIENPYKPVTERVPGMSVVSVGDINYDLLYDELPSGFFQNLSAPGGKVQGPIRRRAGGTAVAFASKAKEAGFTDCAVVGVVGGDELGRAIEDELNRLGIRPVLPRDPNQRTSIAIILRDKSQRDTSLTLTDASQRLPKPVGRRAESDIEEADVFYLSGYALMDPNRKATACRMLRSAREHGCLTILDVAVGMHRHLELGDLRMMLQEDTAGRSLVDILAAEFPDVLAWYGQDVNLDGDSWKTEIEDKLLPKLRTDFTTVFLRTPTYTHEVISTPSGVSWQTLDYQTRPASNRRWYGDERTASHVYSYLSPRLLLASQSPQRLQLLGQIVAPNKIEARMSLAINEGIRTGERPEQRVKRLALAKVEAVLKENMFAPTIEIAIGADTEIVLDEQIIPHPTTVSEANEVLQRLSGKCHSAVTGIAVIGLDPGTGERKTVQIHDVTEVKMRQITPREIADYAESGEPLNRAGGYAIQGRGGLLVERIEGSYSNVVGLPLERLTDVLRDEFANPIWHFDSVSNWRFPRPLRQVEP